MTLKRSAPHDGARLLTSLGDRLWYRLGARLWDRLWDRLGARLWDRLWDRLGARLWDRQPSLPLEEP